MASLGIKHYRLSLSWSRLLPQGGSGTPVNPEGLAFYNRCVFHTRPVGAVLGCSGWESAGRAPRNLRRLRDVPATLPR
jgi:hypothetical protein